MWGTCGLSYQYSLHLVNWLTFKSKNDVINKILSIQDQSSLRYKRNTTVDIDQWKTTCVVSIPMFFIVLKLNIYFILHVLSFEGIIFSINVVYDLKVLAQIDTACAIVDCYCIWPK